MSDRDRRLSELMELRGSGYNNGVIIWWTETQDFSTPKWRARLMDFCVEQEWWDKFVWQTRWKFLNKWENGDFLNRTRDGAFNQYVWRNLPDLVYQYWQERGEGRMSNLHIVFDGPPGPEAGRFVEVENDNGNSVCAGEWREWLRRLLFENR